MNRKIGGALVALSILTGIGVGFAAQRSADTPASASSPRSSSPTPASNETSRTTPTETTSAPKEGEIGDVIPGGVEPIMTGMTIDDALETGLIEQDFDSCVGSTNSWRWTGDLSIGLDVLVDQNRLVSFIGISRPVTATVEGITVGSTLADLRSAYDRQLTGPEKTDYGQATMFLEVDNRWIGFMFDESPDQLTDRSKITFMEVSGGRKPGLVRDGC